MTEEEAKAIPFKMVLLGESGTGKSSVVLRFVRGQFFEYQESTIGAAFLTQTIPLASGTSIKFEIWDTAGQERYKSLAPMYYRGASCAIVVYDITSYESYNRAKAWVKELKRQGSANIIISLAGNKCDLDDQRRVDRREAREYCEENDITFVEVSAKTARNINEMFVTVAKKLEHLTPEDFKSALPLSDLDFRLKPLVHRRTKDFGIDEKELEMEERERLQFLTESMLDFPVPLKNKTIDLCKTFLIGSSVLRKEKFRDIMTCYDGMKDLSLGVDQQTIINIILGRKKYIFDEGGRENSSGEYNNVLDSLLDYYIFFKNLGMMMEVCTVISFFSRCKNYEEIIRLFRDGCMKLENDEIKSWFSEEEQQQQQQQQESEENINIKNTTSYPPPPPPLPKEEEEEKGKKIWASPSHILKKEQEKEERKLYTEGITKKFSTSYCHSLFIQLKNGEKENSELLEKQLPHGVKKRLKKMDPEMTNIIHEEIQNADKLFDFSDPSKKTGEEEEEEENEGEDDDDDDNNVKEEEEEGEEKKEREELINLILEDAAQDEFSEDTPFILRQLWVGRKKSGPRTKGGGYGSTNLILKVNKEEYGVHKEVLVWKSNFFFHMLRFQGAEYESMKEKGAILLEDMKKEDLEILIRVFYTGKADLAEERVIEDAEEEVWGSLKVEDQQQQQQSKNNPAKKENSSLLKKEKEDEKNDENGEEMKRKREVNEKVILQMVSALVLAEKYMERESIQVILDKISNVAAKLKEEGILRILPQIGPQLISEQSKKYLVKTLSFAVSMSEERLEYKIRRATKKKKMAREMEEMVKKMARLEGEVRLNNIKIEEQNNIILGQLEKIKVLEVNNSKE